MMRGDAVNSHSIYLHYIGQGTLVKWTEHSILVMSLKGGLHNHEDTVYSGKTL